MSQPGSKLQNVITFATFTAGIATAVGGFGIGLLTAPADISQVQRDILLVGLAVIVCSMIGAVLTFSNLVFQTAQGTEDLSSNALRLPLLLEIMALWVGLVLFAMLIVVRLGSQMPYSSMTVRDANAAVTRAEAMIPKGERMLKIDRVDVVRGLSDSDSYGVVWFVNMLVCSGKDCYGKRPPHELDVIVDAASGKTRIVAER